MNCKSTETITTIITCAKLCPKPNARPIAEYEFDGFFLNSISEFFDSNSSNRMYRWKVFSEDFEIYDFGWGLGDALINELMNGSTYSNIYLGQNNEHIITFLNTLETTIVGLENILYVELSVKDSSGRESENKYNKYKFTKFKS